MLRFALAAFVVALPASAAPSVVIGQPPPADAPPLDLKALKEKKAEPLLVVIDTPYEIWSGQGTLVHVAAYKPDFSPAKNATVYLGTKAVALTDDTGTAVFRHFPRKDDGQASGDATVRVVQQGETALFSGAVGFNSLRRTESFETAQLFVYTDRGVYNPGQAIRIRAIAWKLKGDYGPLAGKPVELTLLDDKRRIVGGQTLTTDAYGVVTLTIPLPQSIAEGHYLLAAQFENAREETKLRVERVVPPAIEIVHDLKRYFTPNQDALVFNVTVKTLSGGHLRSGKLEAKLEHNGAVLFTESREVSGAEKYAFALEGKPIQSLRERAKEGDRFQVVLTATDGAGRSD